MLAPVQAPPLVLHIVGATLFVGRVAHAISLSLTGDPSPGRVIGMIATWLAFIFASVALLFYAIG